MSTSLSKLVTELQERTQFQETPIAFDTTDYEGFVTNGAKRLYIDLGYSNWTTEYNATSKILTRDLSISEEEYVLIASEIAFFNEIKNNWSTIISYSTNALSITNGEKPYKNIDGMIKDLKDRLSELFYKISAVGGGSE